MFIVQVFIFLVSTYQYFAMLFYQLVTFFCFICIDEREKTEWIGYNQRNIRSSRLTWKKSDQQISNNVNIQFFFYRT